MIRVAAFACAVLATPLAAQDAQFLADADAFIAGFENAVAGEYVIPYQFSTAHRDILEQSARNFPLPFQDYLNLIDDAYKKHAAENESVLFRIAKDDAVFGSDALGGWAVFPFVSQEKHISGRIGDMNCGKLVIFQDWFEGNTFTFLTVVSDPASRIDAISALPRIADMIGDADTAC
ncbi:MAG: hypothetical protein ACSHW1_19955 [Yoonia sp.]|uniref:hypothetical protein n=1 Tax=Yoonia sp. TaxID=2212373 RepID=UPI003EF8E0AA